MERDSRKRWSRLSGGGRLVPVCFLILFLYGCVVFRDYGIGVDEPVERTSSLITWLHLNPSLKDVVTDTVDFSQLPPLQEYQDRYYGVTIMLPCVIAEHLTGFTMPLSQVYAMRHFYNFLIFFTGTVFFYLLCRRLVKRRIHALLGCLFLVLSPRILADAFYNLKDLTFLSLFVISLYACVCFLQRPTLRNTVGLAVAVALCTNVRIIGAYLMTLCLVILFLTALVRERGRAGRRRILAGLAAGGLSLFFYVLITPVTWDAPLRRMMEIAVHFSDYAVWNDYHYYMGQYLTREQMPWHYLPVWMGITTPLVTLIPALGGMGLETVCLLRGRMSKERLLIFLTPVFLLLYVMLRRPTLYNGWRHFYFLAPVWCLFAVFFVVFCRDRLEERACPKILCGLRLCLAAGFFSVILWIGANHPYDYVYFNGPARAWALPRFDLDYWGVSEKDALQYICDHDSGSEIKVFLLTDFSLPLLSQEDRDRICRVATMEDAEYYIHGYHAGALGALLPGCEGMVPWYDIRVDGYPIRTIYRR